jgi:hypothetical protein
MKIRIILLLLAISNSIFAQQKVEVDLQKDVAILKQKVNTLSLENKKLKNQIDLVNRDLSSKYSNLDSAVIKNSNNINESNSNLQSKITETSKVNDQKITEVNDSLSKNTLYWIIAFLTALLLSGIIYILLRKKQNADKTDVELQIYNAKKSLAEESVKLDTKLTEILETQLKAIELSKERTPSGKEDSVIDHSYVLKVAGEIMRINAYTKTLPSTTKGLNALIGSVRRLQDYSKANDYEIVDLTGQKYNDGIPGVVVNYVQDDNLKPGEEIISRMIVPLVKYKGVQIQAPQFEVSIGK